MSKNDVDSRLINHLQDLYKNLDDKASVENANLNQEKPFTVSVDQAETSNSIDNSAAPYQYDYGVTGSK